VYGSWLGTVLVGVVVLALLIGLSVLASPLIAVILALLVAVFGAFVLVASRAGRASHDESSASGPAGRSAYRGGPRPSPPGGGAPVSGEGHSHGGETAGTGRSDS
jgi:hypothetical protein